MKFKLSIIDRYVKNENGAWLKVEMKCVAQVKVTNGNRAHDTLTAGEMFYH